MRAFLTSQRTKTGENPARPEKLLYVGAKSGSKHELAAMHGSGCDYRLFIGFE